MTTVPHPEPTTRAEARANAIACMFDRAHLAATPHRDEHLREADVWCQIALTFPEDQPTIVVDNYSDFQRQMVDDRPIGDPLHHPGGPELEPWTGDSGPDVEPIDDEAATQVLVLPHREPVRVVLEGSGDLTHTDPSHHGVCGRLGRSQTAGDPVRAGVDQPGCYGGPDGRGHRSSPVEPGVRSDAGLPDRACHGEPNG